MWVMGGKEATAPRYVVAQSQVMYIQHLVSGLHVKSLDHVNDNPICRTEKKKKTQIYRTGFWTLWEKARVGWFKRTALKHVYYLG